ncbi:MAG: DUF3168 domain-containing protein [Pseudomonadota bacterium]
MTVRAALYEQLQQISVLTGIVGTNVYPMTASDTVVAPWCLYRMVTQSPRHTTTQYSISDYEFEVALYGPNYSALDEAASAIEGALGANEFTHSGNRYTSRLMAQRDAYEPEEKNYVITIDLTIQETRT